jgi:hypothetical protein
MPNEQIRQRILEKKKLSLMSQNQETQEEQENEEYRGGLKFLVLDLGIFAEQANGLADGGKNKVYYWTPWQTAFPKFKDYAIGLNFDYLEKVLYPADYFDEVDVIVNFDVHFNDIIKFLRSKGYTCFGSGEGEKIENHRFLLKEIQKKVGLKVYPYLKIKGISNLKNYLEKHGDRYIKIDIFRDDIESFYAKDFKSVELLLDEAESALGPFKDEFFFLVEKAIKEENGKRVSEPGIDTFFSPAQGFVYPCLWGWEIEKSCYLSKVADEEEVPEQLKETLDKLAPVLKEMDYRSAFSTEEKVLEDGSHYLLDVCSRLPAPLSALYPAAMENWPEVVYKIAKNIPVIPRWKGKYVGAVPLSSSHAENNWLKLDFNQQLREHIKLRVPTRIGNQYYAVKGMSVVYVLVAWGDTPEDVVEQLKDLVEEVEAYKLDTNEVYGLDKALEEMEKMKEMLGWKF